MHTTAANKKNDTASAIDGTAGQTNGWDTNSAAQKTPIMVHNSGKHR